MSKYSAITLVLILSISVSGCVTERLQSSAQNVGLTTTDIYYYWVLENVIRAKVQPGVMPCGLTLGNGTVSINTTAGMTAGYSETWPNVTPSAGINGNTVNQQSLGVVPVTSGAVLKDLEGYFDKASHQQIFTEIVTTKKTIGSQVIEETKSYTVDASRFIFSDMKGKIPEKAISASFDGQTVYVDTKDKQALQGLTDLTILFMARIAADSSTSKPLGLPAIMDYPLLR